MTPFVYGELADGAFWIRYIADKDTVALTCDPDACTAFARARHEPVEVSDRSIT